MRSLDTPWTRGYTHGSYYEFAKKGLAKYITIAKSASIYLTRNDQVRGKSPGANQTKSPETGKP